ncbi:hypothetical protein HispidOSU_004650 [Sigmodon hispidus]
MLQKCTPPQQQLQCSARSVGRSGSQPAQGVHLEPASRAAPKPTAEIDTCTSIHSQLHRNKLSEPVPQQLRTQAYGSHCACAEAMNYDSQSLLALISETPVLSIGSYLACCAWSLRSGWGAPLLNYCCARGLEA